jgi:hypothetical protein
VVDVLDDEPMYLRKVSSTWRLLAIFLIALVIVMGIVIVYQQRTQRNIRPSSSTAYLWNGLRLTLRLDSPVVRFGSPIILSIDLSNYLTGPLNFSTTTNFPQFGPYYLKSPCDSLIYPMGVEIANGTWGYQNLTSARFLQLLPLSHGCSGSLSYFYFSGPGNIVTVSEQGGRTYSLVLNMTLSYSGYYMNNQFQSLEPGPYTCVAVDQFGQMVILYFTVGA